MSADGVDQGRDSRVQGGLACLRADLGWRGPTVRALLELPTVKVLATVLFRLSQSLGRLLPLAAYVVKQLNHVLTGADLAWQASIGPGLALHHPTGVVIGPDVVAGAGLALQQGVTLGAARERGLVVRGRIDSPEVGDDVQVGSGARLLGPIRVGDRVVVGANAVVLGDVPDDHLAVGVPARVVERG